MVAPLQMTTHTLEAPKGWPSPYAVDYTAKFDPTDLASLPSGIAFAGRCVHVDPSTGYFKMGIAHAQMAMFLWPNSNDPDVSNDGGDPSSVAGAWVAIRPSGNMTALVAAGAYELATTEFDTAQSYLINQTLTAATGTNAAAGRLTNQSALVATNPVCGVVSRLVTTNSHGQSELSFWPVYCPVPNGSSNNGA